MEVVPSGSSILELGIAIRPLARSRRRPPVRRGTPLTKHRLGQCSRLTPERKCMDKGWDLASPGLVRIPA